MPTLRDGKQFSAVPGEAAPRFLFKVTRDENNDTTWDTAWHGTSEYDIPIGTYRTLEKANEVARQDLLDEYARDAFESIEETLDEEGKVHIHAVFVEGEEADVRVVKVPVGGGRA